MSEALEARITAVEQELQGVGAALEVRLRRLWKADIDNAYRGQLNDLLSHSSEHTEANVDKHLKKVNLHGKVSDDLRQHDDRVKQIIQHHNEQIKELVQDTHKSLDDRIANIVVLILSEYKVISGLDNQPIQHS